MHPLHVLQALHTLLGHHIAQAQPQQPIAQNGHPQDSIAGANSQPDSQAQASYNVPVQGDPRQRYLQQQPQGGNFNPGLIQMQGSRNVRPIQARNSNWLDY